ncbi:MAG: hypothetical protein Q7U03_06965 [Syntrophales bacterium]|nr:hypothetical protein [Syntrophales bacterium]
MKDQSKTKQARSESERKKVEQALKESEESGWTILNNIQEGYYEVDLAGNYSFFNPFGVNSPKLASAFGKMLA